MLHMVPLKNMGFCCCFIFHFGFSFVHTLYIVTLKVRRDVKMTDKH